MNTVFLNLRKWKIFICIPLALFGQKKSSQKIDSTAYYIQLANFNKKTDNYKSSLAFSQKAFNYAKAKNNIKGKGEALFFLGTTYFEIKKFNDAIETFNKSAYYYSKLRTSTDYALCFYNIGLCYMNLEDFSKAEDYFDKTQSIYDILKIDASQFLNLQKGIVYSAKGKYKLATPIFDQIIAKPDYLDVFKTKAEAEKALLSKGYVVKSSLTKELLWNCLRK